MSTSQSEAGVAGFCKAERIWIGIDSIVDQLPDAVLQIGADGVVEAANPSVDTLFGWNPADLVGQPATILFGAREERDHQSFFDRYLQGGESGALRVAPSVVSGRHTSGRDVEFEMTVRKTLVAGEMKLIAVCRAVSGRMPLQLPEGDALAELGWKRTDVPTRAATDASKQSFYGRIVEIMPAFLIVKDARDGSLLLLNSAAKDVLGLDPATCLGKTIGDIFPGEEAESSAEEDALVIASRDVSIKETVPITLASGEKKFYTTKKVAVFDGDKPVYVVTVGADVTKQVQARRAVCEALNVAEKANEAKSQFLANMSHELRTPLNGIIAMADMLFEAQTDDRSRLMARTIVDSGAVLAHVVNDILDVAKIEAGQMNLESEPFDLEAVLARVSNIHFASASAKGVKLERLVDPRAAGVYLGDQTRITQIVSNLLSNAVKFTERGRIQISVRRSKKFGLHVRVSDTGQGFDRATATRLFGRFVQADDSVSRRYGGTGLGLSISRSFTQMMGGRILARSVPGKGSLFVVTLPLARVHERQKEHEHRPDQPAIGCQSDVSDVRILIADDHEVNRRIITMILEPLGVDLTTVENGKEAVHAASNGAFDLILMDVQMPLMDGLAATRHIREMERDRGLARTAIISLTANAMSEDIKRSLDAGSDLHISKPIRPADLVKAIADLVTRVSVDEPILLSAASTVQLNEDLRSQPSIIPA